MRVLDRILFLFFIASSLTSASASAEESDIMLDFERLRGIPLISPRPTEPTAPPPKAPPPVVPPPPILITPEDRKTEGGLTVKPCPNCAPNRTPTTPEKIPVDRIRSCYGEHLLQAAKENVRKSFGNRSRSGGECAFGVRTSLDRAKMNKSGGLGDAAEYHGRGTLKRLGFKNIIDQGITAENAPPGAVLVFYGPNTESWLRTGNRGPGKGAGRWAGHVTIKGDDGRYYTDGRTVQPAVAKRRLVGVYVMETCAQCSEAVKRKCGG